MTETRRWISNGRFAFAGCFNFRDLGGYATRDGRLVLPQRLYRADGPHTLDDAAT